MLLAALIIILVSLNWFNELRAQDLSSLSAQEKAKLVEKYRSQKTNNPTGVQTNTYTSPEIYDSTQTSIVIPAPDRAAGSLAGHRSATKQEESLTKDGLVKFENLKPFGLDLFRSGGQTETPVDIATASDYILGPGDNVIVYLWGRVEKEYNLVLDREGKVVIPRVGEIVAWGLSMDQFTTRVKHRLTTVYSEFDLTVSLGKIRSIRIFITGEVNNPGAYNVPSLTSLFNAMYLAGGPNLRGSLRNIRLMRNGTCIKEIDLYQFLLNGENAADIRLQTGDLIFVPVAEHRVAIRGEVKREAWYELTGVETASDLLKLAGGGTALAYLERVMLERVSGQHEWEVVDLDLTSTDPDSSNELCLKDGDRLTVYSIFQAHNNMVAINGLVKHPGHYELTDSTKLSDLVKLGELQPYDVHLERANLFRRYSDNRVEIIPVDLNAIMAGDSTGDIKLFDRDSLHVYSIQELHRERHVYIDGEVNKPGEFPLYDQMTVADVIFLAGSYTRRANKLEVEVARVDSMGDVSLMYLPMSDPNSLTTLLQEDDHLFIRQVSRWKIDHTIEITGEVMYPGFYTLSHDEETLYDILTRVGGFTPNAFATGLVLERESIGISLKRLRIPSLLARSQPIVRDSAGNIILSETFDYDPSLVTRVVLDMDRILMTGGLEADILLQPNDRIFVPQIPSGISVMGAVGANGTFQFKRAAKVKDYVKRAGDFTRQSDKKKTQLIRANGEVYSGGGTLKQEVRLGDVIVVPSKIIRERNSLKTISTTIAALTGALTSIYLISRL